MPAVLAISAVAAVGLTAYSAVEQRNASANAAQVDNATAAYNAKYDTAVAQQTDLDTQENIRTERQDDAVYLSRQQASYADAGVLATTGSALDAQITTAGRLEQRIQQEWVNSQQQQQADLAQARIGVLAGQAQASADRASGTIALLNGGANIARMAFSDYQSGVFSFGGGGSGAEPPDAGG